MGEKTAMQSKAVNICLLYCVRDRGVRGWGVRDRGLETGIWSYKYCTARLVKSRAALIKNVAC